MRLYTCYYGGEKFPAAEKNGKLYRAEGFADMNDLIRRWDEFEVDMLADEVKEGYRTCSPIEPLQDVICLGVNYQEHRAEASDGIGFDKEDYSVYFSKRVSVPTGDGDMIPHYDFVEGLDYEAELGVVVGRTCVNVSAEEALDYVFGYTVINDVSARNLQKNHKQFYRGKSLDGYTPMGPCIVTADEISDPQNLEISCTVNGETRQKSNTSNMIAGVAEILSELSHGITLRPGCVISTGTPAGTGMGMKPPCFLKPGDEVVCTIEKIGSLRNICE